MHKHEIFRNPCVVGSVTPPPPPRGLTLTGAWRVFIYAKVPLHLYQHKSCWWASYMLLKRAEWIFFRCWHEWMKTVHATIWVLCCICHWILIVIFEFIELVTPKFIYFRPKSVNGRYCDYTCSGREFQVSTMRWKKNYIFLGLFYSSPKWLSTCY